MGLVSTGRYNAAVTNSSYLLRAAVRVEAVGTVTYQRHLPDGTCVPYEHNPHTFRVVGECGHTLAVVHAHQVQSWEDRIAAGSRHRRRCELCPRVSP